MRCVARPWAEAVTAERPARRTPFFAQGRACLRASDLGRRYGWGIHADGQGRIALVGMETEEYAAFLEGRRLSASGTPIRVVRAMRRSREQTPGQT